MNRKKVQWTAAIALLLFCGGAYLYNGVLYKEARNIEKEEAAHRLAASQLLDAYKRDLTASDQSYLNKTIEVSGKVTQVSDSLLTLDSGITCTFGKMLSENIVGAKVTLKGRCIGFDELMEEVKLDQCTLIQ
ncbi:TRNA-anti-like protein [compost metagenome]